MNRTIFILGIIAGLFLIGACSGNKAAIEGPLAVQEAELGPETKELLKEIPNGLVADTANSRYTSRALRGEDEDDGQ